MDYKWLVSSLIVGITIAIGLWQYFETRRKQLLVDLQGDKNAVAAVAMRVRTGSIPRRRKHRQQLFEGLCIAAVYQRSGRSRSLIYGALLETERYRREIGRIVDSITVTVSRSSAYTDLERARRMVVDLRAALRLDGDVRLRIDALELGAHTDDERWPPDPRLVDPAFSWTTLERLVGRLGKLVVVGPSEGSCPVLSLDHHRVRRKIAGQPPERPILTPAGERVVAAKYTHGDVASSRSSHLVPGRAVAWLVEQFAILINEHPLYRSASSVAAVPGTRHDFSDELGKVVSQKVDKEFVRLRPSDESFDHAPHLIVVNSSGVKDKSVIVVDDVYRSGQTLQAAAVALREAGAEYVVGLTATCTLSGLALACGHDMCRDDDPSARA